MYSADDPDLAVNLSKVQKRIDELTGELEEKEPVGDMTDALVCDTSEDVLKCNCCCRSHCGVAVHNLYGTRSHAVDLQMFSVVEFEDVGCEEDLDAEERTELNEVDTFTALIMSVGRAMC